MTESWLAITSLLCERKKQRSRYSLLRFGLSALALRGFYVLGWRTGEIATALTFSSKEGRFGALTLSQQRQSFPLETAKAMGFTFELIALFKCKVDT